MTKFIQMGVCSYCDAEYTDILQEGEWRLDAEFGVCGHCLPMHEFLESASADHDAHVSCHPQAQFTACGSLTVA